MCNPEKKVNCVSLGLLCLFWFVSPAAGKQLTPRRYWEPDHVRIEATVLAAPYVADGRTYWSEGNNIQRRLTWDGSHCDWPNLNTMWPRGSGNAHDKATKNVVMAHGEFNHQEGEDTVCYRMSGDRGGRIPNPDKYRGTGAYYQAMVDRRIKVSTREEDLATWPPEFSADVDGDGIPGDDLDGDGYGDLPIVNSDEDVVMIFSSPGPYTGQNSGGTNLCVQIEERVMSFSPVLAQDILFHEKKIRNMSRWHFFPDMGPFDWYGVGIGCNWEQNQATTHWEVNQKFCWVDGLSMESNYNPDFLDPNIEGLTPIQAKIFLRPPDMTDPTTGDHLYDEEGNPIPAPLILASHYQEDAGWGFWNYVPDPYKYRTIMAVPPKDRDKWRSKQDPGVDWDNRGSMLPRIAVTFWRDFHIMYGDPDMVVTVDDTAIFAYAQAFARPATSSPWNSVTPEAIDKEIGPLKSLAGAAHMLYGNWKLPRAPKAPNSRLIPGDRQVTVTWDNLSFYSRDSFYDAMIEQGIVSDYKLYDFEGYRVYRSTTGKLEDAVLIAQFDLKNHVTLETGIRSRKADAKVLTEDGQEVTGYSLTELDTVGISQYDPDRGAVWGLGQDTGLRFSFVDKWIEAVPPGQDGIRRLTNGFRYFYNVTAYDFNYTDSTDLFSYNSLESPVQFSASNMVIPRENASSYRPARITDNMLDLELTDGAGNALDKLPRDVRVAGDLLLDESEVSNALQNLYVTIVNPALLDGDGEYFISLDSITNEPNEFFPEADYRGLQTIHVSLKDDLGNVLNSKSSGLGLDIIGVESELEKLDPVQFVLYPLPDSATGQGIPFNIEFDIMPAGSGFLLVNPVEVLSGVPLSEDLEVEVKKGYSDGNNNHINAFRAADFEIEWIDAGDSLTVQVKDVTHGLDIPFRPLPGPSWAFVGSWSRFNRLAVKPREELQDKDFKDVTSKMSKTPKKAGAPVKATLYLSGVQIKITALTLPQPGDLWRVRTGYGALPDDSLGVLEPRSRPAVAGLRYRIVVKDDKDNPEDVVIEQVKVVPNPYLVANAWELSPQRKRLAFINLPSRAVVRIYTISGNLIQVLRHEGIEDSYTNNWKGGTEYWDLKNRFNMLVASGLYIFHVTDVRTGKKQMGKFAIIQ